MAAAAKNDGGGANGGAEGFDLVLDRLKGVVDRLEHGNLSLEDSLQTFEEGIGLARRGHALLDSAEQRVEVLVRGPDGDRVEPLRGDDPT